MTSLPPTRPEIASSRPNLDFNQIPGLAETILAAINNAGIGMSIVYSDEPNAGFVYLGDAAVALLGRSREELVRLGPLAAVAPDELQHMRERAARRAQGELPPNHFETAVLREDGQRVPVEVHLTRGTFAGRPVSVAFFFDLDERQKAALERRRSDARFRELIESAPDPVWIFDGRRLRFVNPAAVRLLGHPNAESLLASDPREFVAPEVSALVRSRTQEMLATGKPLPPMDFPTRRFDGSYVTVEVSSIPIEFEGAPALLSFGRDMTERRRLEGQLALDDRLVALGTMAAGIAHEINNPLTYTALGIDVAAAQLSKFPASEATATALSALADAQEGVSRVAEIVSQMRAFARADRDGGRPEAVEVVPVIESALRMARHEIVHRARLITRFEPIPAVLAPREKLSQVVLNLLINAAQALSGDASALHEIEVHAYTDEQGNAVIDVRDTGSGIPAEVLPRIFEPFFTTKPVGRGTGLGLAICHGIVTACGGDISVRPGPGRGSVFRVVLPPAGAARALAAARMTTVRAASHPPVRRRVLVVDDEAMLTVMVARLIGDVHEVETASSTEEALAEIERVQGFDSVVCDLIMPGLSGMDLHAAVALRWPGLERRFVFMTGGAFTDGAAKFLASVPNPRLDKPMSYAALLAAIEAVARPT